MTPTDYDIIVIGGGHAGSEAAWAGANLGARVALITMDTTKIGAMSCNPAIGGLAKGQIVREIDALGGLMGLAADATGIQFRILNQSKGPAVHGPRCQSDKYRYAHEVQRLLQTRREIDILEGAVSDFQVEGGHCVGVMLGDKPLRSRAVVLTTGTFMRGLMHTGQTQTPGGRVDEKPAMGISQTLEKLGFELGRLKTGTPPRLDVDTLDTAGLQVQPGDAQPIPFSELTSRTHFPPLPQRDCWITYTNEASHEHIRANLDRSPIYNGQIQTAGPRYCPSIEDKVVRFKDRQAHHVFLEPESLDTNEVYCNGISTSLPCDVQDFVVHQLPGCEKARILRYGYAVEYDMVRPHQIDATAMTKKIPGLFLAGQINGTSGYEEAAGQGLIAGLNAVRWARGQELVRLRRDEAYLGVMMDDLTTTVPLEPYRMFTSRAEFRLLLRSDNAPWRLTPQGRAWGLVDDARWNLFEQRDSALEQLKQSLPKRTHQGVKMLDWCRRPEAVAGDLGCDDTRLAEHLLAELKYEGYLARQDRDVQKLREQEAVLVPEDLQYSEMTGLRNESKQVLSKFKPSTLGQASRIAGITPADLMVLSIAINRHRHA